MKGCHWLCQCVAAAISDYVVSHVYDYANRMISRVVDSDGTGASVATVEKDVFAYDGNQVVAKFTHSGTGDAAVADLKHQ